MRWMSAGSQAGAGAACTAGGHRGQQQGGCGIHRGGQVRGRIAGIQSEAASRRGGMNVGSMAVWGQQLEGGAHEVYWKPRYCCESIAVGRRGGIKSQRTAAGRGVGQLDRRQLAVRALPRNMRLPLTWSPSTTPRDNRARNQAPLMQFTCAN